MFYVSVLSKTRPEANGKKINEYFKVSINIRHRGYVTGSCSIQLSMKVKLLINITIAEPNGSLRFKSSKPVSLALKAGMNHSCTPDRVFSIFYPFQQSLSS